MARLELIALENVGRIRPGDDLAAAAARACAAQKLVLSDGDILAVAQKIVSKSEGRFAVLEEVVPSARAVELAQRCLKDPRYVELVLRESRAVVRAVPNVLIVEDR